MSYANGTTHYNLPQTVGTDKRDWFDTNEAFANVDADLNTAYTTANAVAANVSALSDRVATNEGDITDLKAEDVAINARVSTLGDSVSALSATVRDNKQDLSDAICSVVEGSATAAYSHEVGSYFWYNDTLYITTVAIDIGDTIVPNTNCDTVTVTTELVRVLNSGVQNIQKTVSNSGLSEETFTFNSNVKILEANVLDARAGGAVGGFYQADARHCTVVYSTPFVSASGQVNFLYVNV